jgi:hypothetical protein
MDRKIKLLVLICILFGDISPVLFSKSVCLLLFIIDFPVEKEITLSRIEHWWMSPENETNKDYPTLAFLCLAKV